MQHLKLLAVGIFLTFSTLLLASDYIEDFTSDVKEEKVQSLKK
jgi:hypothetical protein